MRAQYLPQIGFGVQAGGKYAEATGIVQSYAVEPTLSWEVSLFGALRRAKEAAKAEIAASAWALEGMRLSLAAEVATTYFTLLEYERNLSIARRTLQLRRESAALIDSMFRYGMSDGVALEQARSLVRTAEADIPQYRRAVVQTALSLGTLLGELPAQDTLQGRRAAPAHRHLPRGDSRGTALGVAAQTTRHPGSALRRGESRGAGRTGPERAVSVDLADGRRRCGVGFDQRG